MDFRDRFLTQMNIQQIHLFDSRTEQFSSDRVLQENVIMQAIKDPGQNPTICISHSNSPTEKMFKTMVNVNDVIHRDSMKIIHIPGKSSTSRLVESLPCTLADIGLGVSTGKVVDFRTSENLRYECDVSTVPLVRPFNISSGIIKFPVHHKHPGYIVVNKGTENLLVPNGIYVLVKRFTTKEEKKRLVASVWNANTSSYVGFENRINYFHRAGGWIDRSTAYGLWAYLNSTVLDSYFREFGGNTQVNATDLRHVRYPSQEQLVTLGNLVSYMESVDQRRIDETCESVLFC